jgi:hypothetical protein
MVFLTMIFFLGLGITLIVAKGVLMSREFAARERRARRSARQPAQDGPEISRS